VKKRARCKVCKKPIFGPTKEFGRCLACYNKAISEAMEGAERERPRLVDRSLLPRILQPGEVLPEARMRIETQARGVDRLGEHPFEVKAVDFRDVDRFEPGEGAGRTQTRRAR
jgi:hypothetical protein